MFNLRNTTLCALAAILMVAAGCTNRGPWTDPAIVRFTSSARDYDVKATDVTLSDGDEVGIFAGEPFAVGNVRGVVSGKSIFPEREMYWEDGQQSATRFSAYCPYVPDVPGEIFPFSVSEDQRLYAGYAASDLRTASVAVSPCNVVNFVFEHRMSKLILDIEPGGRVISDVAVGEVFRDGTMDMATGEVSDLSGSGYVHAGLAAVSAEARAYVAVFMPETVRLELLITADGKKYLYTLEEPQEFLSGCAYYASILLDDGDVVNVPVGFSVTVTDWESGEPLEFMPEP